MFVHFGKRFSRRKLGFAADFCPICREVRAFRISEVRHVTHLNYIPLGKGDLVHHEALCQRCDTIQPIATLPYSACVPAHKGDAFDLAARTHPDIGDTRAELIELERRADEGTLEPSQRATIIARAIAALDYAARLRKHDGSIRPGAAASGVVSLLAVLAAAFAWSDPNAGWIARTVTTVIALGTFLLTVRLAMGSKRWWAAKFAYPKLARALIPLAPTRDELLAATASVSSGGAEITRLIDVDDLERFLHRSDAR